jgi:hypothetical protein
MGAKMGMNGNLPPGVTDRDLPGNRYEDERFEEFCEKVTKSMEEYGIDIDDIVRCWEWGVDIYIQVRVNARMDLARIAARGRAHYRRVLNIAKSGGVDESQDLEITRMPRRWLKNRTKRELIEYLVICRKGRNDLKKQVDDLLGKLRGP